METTEEDNLSPEEPIKIQSGGHSWDLFIPSISAVYCDRYSCSICYLVMKDPFRCQNNHFYCKSCIYNWIISSNRCSLTCPVCRDPGPFEPDPKLKSQLQSLSVCCLREDCCWVGKLSGYYSHIHGLETSQVPDLMKTVKQEHMKKSRTEGFISEDRFVTMMSVIYADIEHRRRRIETIRSGGNEYSQQQLEDIQLLHDRLISLRQNIDTFFGQTDSSVMFGRFASNRTVSNSSLSSGPSEVSEQPFVYPTWTESPGDVTPLADLSIVLSDDNSSSSDVFLHEDRIDPANQPEYDASIQDNEDETLQDEVAHTNLPWSSSEIFDFTENERDLTISPEYDAIIQDNEEGTRHDEIVHTNLPRSSSETFDCSQNERRFSVTSELTLRNNCDSVDGHPRKVSSTSQTFSRPNSTATSRLRHDYLSRRFNLRTQPDESRSRGKLH